MWNCVICKEEFINYIALTRHIKNKHSLSPEQYYTTYIQPYPKCKNPKCENNVIFYGFSGNRKIFTDYCCKKCQENHTAQIEKDKRKNYEIKCEICSNDAASPFYSVKFKSYVSLSHHIKNIHSLTCEQYYVKYIEDYPKCANPACNNKTKFIHFADKFSKFCCKGCNKKIHKERSFKRKEKIIKDRSNYKFECKICGFKSPKAESLGGHIVKTHHITTEEYYLKFINPIRPKCHRKECENYTRFKTFIHGYATYCSNKCCALCEDQKEKSNRTLLEKFGEKVENRFQLTTIKEKMKQTNLNKFGAEQYSQSEEGIKNMRKIMEEKKLWVPYDSLPDFEKYRRLVEKHTAKNRHKLENYDKRSKFGWHVDHIYSVKDGFENNICPYVIGSLYNLKMIPWLENIKKNSKSLMTKEELLENWKNENNIIANYFE